MNRALLLMLAISLFWGSWQLITNASDIQNPYVRGFLVNLITAAGFLPFVWGDISPSTFVSRGGIILLVGGLVNFVGHALIPRLQIATGAGAGAEVSVYGAIIPALCMVVMVTGGIAFYHESTAVLKIFFILIIIVGVVGLGIVSQPAKSASTTHSAISSTAP